MDNEPPRRSIRRLVFLIAYIWSAASLLVVFDPSIWKSPDWSFFAAYATRLDFCADLHAL